MSAKPAIKQDDMYQLLRCGHVGDFNARKARGEACDLRHCDFRSVDLRGLDAAGLDFSGCYFRQSDLRGVDFSTSHMEGSSINGAKISGTYFPAALTAEEIQLSLVHGTRMRYRHGGAS